MSTIFIIEKNKLSILQSLLIEFYVPFMKKLYPEYGLANVDLDAYYNIKQTKTKYFLSTKNKKINMKHYLEYVVLISNFIIIE